MPISDLICEGPADTFVYDPRRARDTPAAPTEVSAALSGIRTLELAYRSALPWFLRPVYALMFCRP
jgi:hypothetical protein